MFFGNDDFEYKYSVWECEMNMDNPSHEQIVAYVKEHNEGMSEEYIEEIIQYTGFYDSESL